MSKNYWFKRKRYGYGAVPTTTQGTLLIITYLVILLGGSWLLLKDVPEGTYTKEVGYFFMLLLVSTGITVYISYKKSPKWKWRWGKKKTDNPADDF